MPPVGGGRQLPGVTRVPPPTRWWTCRPGCCRVLGDGDGIWRRQKEGSVLLRPRNITKRLPSPVFPAYRFVTNIMAAVPPPPSPPSPPVLPPPPVVPPPPSPPLGSHQAFTSHVCKRAVLSLESPTLPLINNRPLSPIQIFQMSVSRGGGEGRVGSIAGSAGVGRWLWHPDRGVTDTVHSIDHDTSSDESPEGGDVEHFCGNAMTKNDMIVKFISGIFLLDTDLLVFFVLGK